MKNRLYLNHNVFIDLPKLIVSKLLAVANSGGGKSWLIRRIVEQAYGKVQIIIIDPEGEFSTLREKYDFVLCGKGMDAPAEPRSAGLLALRLLESKTSAVIDLYELHPQERKRFVRLFFESMVNAPKNLYNDCLVILDEAHRFAPEKEESESLGAVVEMASLGRKRGFSLILATQRISKLSKDAAAECNNKLIGRTSLDIDRKRAADELGIMRKEDILALRVLEPGEFFAFGPAISNDVIKVRVGDIKTSIPKAGRQTKVAPPTDAIKKALAALADLPQEAEQEAHTVAELKKENAVLKGKLTRLPQKIVESASKDLKNTPIGVSQWRELGKKFSYWDFFEKQIIIERDKEWEVVFLPWSRYAKRLYAAVRKLAEEANEPTMQDKISPAKIVHSQGKGFEIPKQEYIPPLRLVPKEVDTTVLDYISKPMGIGERKILIACAQHNGATREHLTVLTGYKRSSRDAYIQRLQARGYTRVANGKINATSEGVEALGGDYEPLPTGDELQAHLMRTLPIGERKILGILIGAYPDAVDREELTIQTNYQRSSRDAYLQRLNARQLVVYEGRGRVKATETLFA